MSIFNDRRRFAAAMVLAAVTYAAGTFPRAAAEALPVTTTVPAATSTVPAPTSTVPGPTSTVPGPTSTVPATTTTSSASGSTTTTSPALTSTTPGGASVLNLSAGSVVNAASALAGGGSSFAGVEMNQWTDDVSSLSPPLEVTYNPTSSGDGRTFFRNGTDAYGVTDIPYQGNGQGDPPPAFAFEYIPMVAGGLGFMYNLPGNPVLKLNAATACGIFTGEITNWDDSNLASLNPGVTLPNLAITPVLRGDLAGTNFVLQQWCIAEAPTVWASFASYVAAHPEEFSNSDTPAIGPTTPSSAFPVLPNDQTADGDSGTASVVGSSDGSGDITYVEPEYAKEYGNMPVAFVENASGDFVQPTPENVAGALSYATGESDGIQVLNFGGTGCNVYNPSTYSYMLARTDGSYGTGYGQVLGGFLNYVLTVGEKEAPSIDYADIGLALEQYGVTQATNIPGYPALTPTEQANFAAGDVTPSIVQQTACGAAFQLAAPATTTTTAATTTTGKTAPGVTTATTTEPSTSTPKTTTPATTAPRTTTPGSPRTSPTTPRTTTPGSARTSPTTRGSTSPGSTAPGSTTPGPSRTSPATPGSTAPGTTTPGSPRTSPTTPGTTTPGSPRTNPTTPGTTTPGTTTPGTTTPGSPRTSPTTPGPDRPGSTTPSSTVPGSPRTSLGGTVTGTVPPTTANGTTGTSTTGSPGTTGIQTGGVTGTVASGNTPGSSTTGAAVTPGVTLSNGTPGDAQTGGQELLLALAGLGIAGTSELARRRWRRARQ